MIICSTMETSSALCLTDSAGLTVNPLPYTHIRKGILASYVDPLSNNRYVLPFEYKNSLGITCRFFGVWTENTISTLSTNGTATSLNVAKSGVFDVSNCTEHPVLESDIDNGSTIYYYMKDEGEIGDLGLPLITPYVSTFSTNADNSLRVTLTSQKCLVKELLSIGDASYVRFEISNAPTV